MGAELLARISELILGVQELDYHCVARIREANYQCATDTLAEFHELERRRRHFISVTEYRVIQCRTAYATWRLEYSPAELNRFAEFERDRAKLTTKLTRIDTLDTEIRERSLDILRIRAQCRLILALIIGSPSSQARRTHSCSYYI